jgi:hypothetical protein
MPRINFGIYAKYKPVKISWNLEQWQYTCHRGSFLINHPFSQTVIGGYGYYLENFYCLGRDEKEVVWDITNSYRYGWVETFPTEAGTMDTMYLHQIGIKRYDFFDNPCRFSDTDDSDRISEVNIYPNPASDEVYIVAMNETGNSNDYLLNIFNSTGSVVKQVSYLPRSVNISEMASGFYFITIQNKETQEQKTYKLLISR